MSEPDDCAGCEDCRREHHSRDFSEELREEREQQRAARLREIDAADRLGAHRHT